MGIFRTLQWGRDRSQSPPCWRRRSGRHGYTVCRLFCETQWRHSVKTRLDKSPSPILHCISQLGENKRGQGHWVSQNIWVNDRPWASKAYILTLQQPIRGPPLDSQGGGRSICRRQIIYFNRARRRVENFTFFYIFIWNSSWSKLFISRRVRPKLFISKILLPPPWESSGGPLTIIFGF